MFSYSILFTKKGAGAFQRSMLFICLLIFVNIIYKFRWAEDGLYVVKNLWSPTWMLFGPLLFFGCKALVPGQKKNKYFLHLLPFFVVSLLYVFTFILKSFIHQFENESYVIYRSSYLLISVSLWIYSYKTLRTLYAIKNYTPSTDLLVIISALYILIGFLLAMRYFCWGIFRIDMGMDYRVICYFLLLMVSVFVFRHLYLGKKSVVSEEGKLQNPRYSNSVLKPDVAENYKRRIIEYFETTQIYLRPNLSLELLSRNLDIPKRYLPQIFNVYFKVNFYRFIAQYRIEFALNEMRSANGMLTIESLAYECGFNSKTSFNRYFKEITGLTPREYQDRHLNFTIMLKTA